MPDAIQVELLCREWMHSHEEDTATDTVYRPRSYPFPPSRGRRGFVLHPDGTAVERGPGPADRNEGHPAAWSLEGGDRLTLYDVDRKTARCVMLVRAVDKDRLVVRR